MTGDETEEIIERISRAEWEQREIYAQFGVATYFCQVLETQLVNYLALLSRANSGRPMADEEVDELFDRLFGGTFGRNLKAVRDLLGDDWVLADEMAAALKLRNELVHHWMRDRALKQDTSDDRRAMVEELKAAQAQLRSAEKRLTARTKAMWDQAGLPWEWVEREYARLREVAERQDRQSPE